LNGGLSTFTGVIFYLGIYTFTQVQLLSTFTTPDDVLHRKLHTLTPQTVLVI